jgi:hypothetical protein
VPLTLPEIVEEEEEIDGCLVAKQAPLFGGGARIDRCMVILLRLLPPPSRPS